MILVWKPASTRVDHKFPKRSTRVNFDLSKKFRSFNDINFFIYGASIYRYLHMHMQTF